VIHGREADLAAIDDLLADVRLRRSGTLLLEGEAGIGKTALLNYAAARCDGLDGCDRTLVGRAGRGDGGGIRRCRR
jgi:predicted ATPase